MATHTVHLIDASPYIFRAYFSLPLSMTSPGGDPVNAVYGFGSFLIGYLAEEQPTHLAVAFDESLTTSFRNDLYPEYKAQRELPPAELERQLKACQAMARALGAQTFTDLRYEADDLIATLCRGLTRKGHKAVITTSDKDLAQLVSEDVELYDYAKKRRSGVAQVVERFGVRPDQMTDYLGLMGDSVDNIPGVPGVGPKTASRLLQAFEDLDAVYADLERVAELEIRGARSLAAKLAEHRELAFLSRTLATVAFDAPAAADLRALRYRGASEELVAELFAELGFEGLRGRVAQWA